MANYKRKKSRYKFRCAMCSTQSRAATMGGDLNKKDIKNDQIVKEAKKETEQWKETHE